MTAVWNKLAVPAVLAAGLLTTGCAGACKQKLDDLQGKYDALSKSHADLQRRNQDLEKENATLKSDDAIRDAYIQKLQKEEALGKEIQELQAKLEELMRGEGGVVTRLPGGGWSVEGDHLFDPGRAVIRKAGADTLKKMAGEFKGAAVFLRIMGYTDSDPIKVHVTENPTKMNLELSARRAVAVAHEFHLAGVEESRMHIVGMGDANPVAPNNSKENKKKNRRVEIWVSSSGPGMPTRGSAGKDEPSK